MEMNLHSCETLGARIKGKNKNTSTVIVGVVKDVHSKNCAHTELKVSFGLLLINVIVVAVQIFALQHTLNMSLLKGNNECGLLLERFDYELIGQVT